ncbi:MAG: LPS export ABC transporter permease LptF [Betaproteobacteria bacterium]|nr:LPS export ABC transporter permease LptF [Betaproteobacteria bacterium]MCH9849657.1 LPS export ABC transporter permease LptF [Betaproteobacteria bacterium]
MKIFKKSLSHELIFTATALFVILIGIVVAQRAGFLVGKAAKGWIPNDALTTILGFNLIRFLPALLSLSIFLAVLLTLTRWYRDSEMVIWLTSGLGITKWIRPILNFAVPVITIITVLSFFVMPWANQKVTEYENQLKARDESSSISPGVFKESNNGERVYFVEGFDELGNVVKNVFIQSTQHQKTGIIVASKGSRYTAENDDRFILLENGRRYQGKPNSAEMSSTEFERYALRLETKEVAVPVAKTETISSMSLISSESPRGKAELQSRLAIPVSAFILVLLAIPLSFVDPRAGRSLNVMLAVFIFIIYNNMLNIFEAWITQSKIHPIIGLWPVHGLFALLAIYLFYRRNYLLPILPITITKLIPKRSAPQEKKLS